MGLLERTGPGPRAGREWGLSGAAAHLGEEGLLGHDGPPRLSQEPRLPAPSSSRAGQGLQPLWGRTGTFYCKNGITDNIWDF